MPADGRHYKHFLLVDPSTSPSSERMAVIGEDSARQDRRYTYKACDDLGGFCFENCKAVRRPRPAGGWEGSAGVLRCKHCKHEPWGDVPE